MFGIGIVGAGSMGSVIAHAIDRAEIPASLVGVTDLDSQRAEKLAGTLEGKPPVLSVDDLADASDLVVETAGPAALEGIVQAVIHRGKDLVVLSIGGLIDRDDWIRLAAEKGSTIYCPSGAIAGLDAVKAAGSGTIREARITTRKPPSALVGAPYLDANGIVLDELEEATIVFEGTARDACRGFPANVNVSAALSLAGIGVDRTRVTIVADPAVERNIHEVVVVGDFGRFRTVMENAPSPDNPRTSRIAALSAIALLKNLSATLRLGT